MAEMIVGLTTKMAVNEISSSTAGIDFRRMIEDLTIGDTSLEMGVKRTNLVEGTADIEEGIKTDETKVRAIFEMKPPRNSKEVSKFLGAESIRRGQDDHNESASFKVVDFKAFRVIYGCKFNRRRSGSKSVAETSCDCFSHA
ncbi:hypothetical protein TNCV_4642541 [Trichonephila clavipes]|nr:hypothetical protein TNCV_4642541 [Trichonephila clavipes]